MIEDSTGKGKQKALPEDDDNRQGLLGSTLQSESVGRNSFFRRRKWARRRTALKFSERLWVVGTLSLIIFLGYSAQGLLINYYFHSRDRILVTFWELAYRILLPFNTGLFAIFYNYYLCVSSDPGSPPKGWEPPVHLLKPEPDRNEQGVGTVGDDDDAPLAVLREKHRTGVQGSNGSTPWQPRYCRHCQGYKPPRAHHCKTCRRCVLRMDHHCPWVANCVGHGNYAPFIRFLFAVDVTCTAHLVLITTIVLDYWGVSTSGYFKPPSTRALVLIILNYIVCFIVLLLVGVFSLWHFYLLVNNMTTIESSEIERVETLIKRGRLRRRSIDFPFSLSLYSNIASVLGSTPLTWCLPAAGPIGDGCVYATADHIRDQEQFDWPPRDPLKVMQQQYSHRQKLASPGQQYRLEEGKSATINPVLIPTNSATLRQRRGQTQDVATDHSEENEKARSSHATPEYYKHSPWHPGFNAEHDDRTESESSLSHSSIDRPMDAEEDESEGQQDQYPGHADTQSRVRRGSEGYEVRPKRFDIAYEHEQRLLEEQMLREYFDRQRTDGSEARSSVLLPSQVLSQRASADTDLYVADDSGTDSERM